MLKYLFLSVFVLQIISCDRNSNDSEIVATATDTSQTKSSGDDAFFPVTSYLRGQINDIRMKGVNPMMYTTRNKQVDSTWLKAEDFEKAMSPFLEVDIDTANLKHLFSEKKFLDQTLNAYTFTYDPKTILPDSLAVQHWDVYVDPNSNKVKRIYIIRKDNDKQEQLTWQSDKWCKMLTIKTDDNGNSIVEKEVFINWDF